MDSTRLRSAIAQGRIGVTDVTPTVEGGRFPARAIAGEIVPFAATVFREGHDAVGATAVLTSPSGTEYATRMHRTSLTSDRYVASAPVPEIGRWRFRIEAWSDPFSTWEHAVIAKVEAGQTAADLANDLATGVGILQTAASTAPESSRAILNAAIVALQDRTATLLDRVAIALGGEVAEILDAAPVRELVTLSPTYELWVDRRRAAVGSWYEFFPRSTGGLDGAGRQVHGTFASASKELLRIATMGFDVVYFPPIHPIGEVNRKGRNNTLVAEPEDVGSPWAVGSRLGGHDAVHPDLGTIDDFDRLVAEADRRGIEIALDLALQCAPDHPWVKAHPEWFTTLADGTIAFAENPPKKYQDIYPLNFDNDPEGLYAEVLRVVTFWIEHGVTIFRVDNPHTKPLNFWQWLIWEVKRDHPEVIFLAEAFTRPSMMKGLGRRGFSQSYTYFTWRTAKWELEEFGEDLVASADYLNPNLFVNTPDILHESLQYGGLQMFRIRAVLASTMSGSWGVYSGFELGEHVAVRPGSEEYLDSEKYQLRHRDWNTAAAEGRSIGSFLRQLNEARRAHPALESSVRNLVFHHSDNENVIVYSRSDAASGDTVIVVCSLDSYHTAQTTIRLTMPELGLGWDDRFTAYDELTGESYDWGEHNFVELRADGNPAHVIAVRPS